MIFKDPWCCPDCKKANPNKCALHEGGSVCPITGLKQTIGTDLMLLRTIDYDCGLLNNYGGGNIEYIRSLIKECNGYWRTNIANGPKG